MKKIMWLFNILLPFFSLLSTSEAVSPKVNEIAEEIQRGGGKVCVYDIPQDEGRSDAVGYIKDIHQQLFSNLESIDASKLDEEALKQKLQDNFILYTTIGSRMFNAVTGPLHITIDGGKLHWKGVTAPVSELRLIFVGKNPYGRGHCVVYCAGSNRLIKNINVLMHGPCSYHIFQGDKLLKEGGDNLSRGEAVEDVEQFFTTLQRVHPDLLAKVNLEDYRALKKQTLDDIAHKLDKDGMLTVEDLAFSLYRAAAFFGDGHTRIMWRLQPNESNTAGKRFPPYILGYDNGRFVIAASDDNNLKGMQILSINGRPMIECLRPILDRCSGETVAFKVSQFVDDQTFWYSFCKLYVSPAPLTLGLRDGQGKEIGRKVETVEYADFQRLSSAEPASKLKQLWQQGAQVRFFDSGKIAHFIYPQFIYGNQEKKKIDAVFQKIKAQGAEDLVIDIRGNGGGNSAMGDFIFSYLYANPFRAFSKVRAKLSRDVLSPNYLNHMQASMPKEYRAKYRQIVRKFEGFEGLVVTEQFPENSASKPAAFFPGRKFLLVDNGTFSSASDFAAMFRDYGLGPIVGYETGGLSVCFGDVYSFNLANSGISCGVSWKQFFNPKPRFGDDQHGVIPEVPVNETLLRPYINEEDPILAFTLDHIKKTRKGHKG
jgi:hypothetical protein